MKTRLQDIHPAYLCLEIAEVAHLWHKHPNSVRRAIDDRRLVARQMSSGRWLIYTPSAFALWGEPKGKLDTLL
ncbi:MAG: hypothetical protein ACK4SA_20195 [Caldilinea sp.]